MAHVCSNFVVDFDGKSFITGFLDGELFIYFTVSDMQQSIHWHSIRIPRFWERQVTQELFIYFDWTIQQEGSTNIFLRVSCVGKLRLIFSSAAKEPSTWMDSVSQMMGISQPTSVATVHLTTADLKTAIAMNR